MIVLDASAILAYLRGEPGEYLVEEALEAGACCSAANWSETMQKTLQANRNWNAARQVLEARDLVIEPVTTTDAEWAAAYWLSHPSLSLGDRLCLALGYRLSVPVLTADAALGTSAGIHQIR